MVTNLETSLQDVAFACRQLRKRPGFTFIAIFVLALGLGGNAAMFSVVNAVLLRPLPYADPDKLVALFERDVVGEQPFNVVAPASFLDWRRDTRNLDQIAASGEAAFNLSSPSGSFAPERIFGNVVSANFFATLGVQPILGRGFGEAEDRPGAQRVVVLSFGLWQRRFSQSRGVIGQTVRLNNEDYSVIGVMPGDFEFPSRTIQAWIPLQRYLSPESLRSYSTHRLNVIGRLRPGVSVEEARAEIDGMVRRYKRAHPEEIMGKGGNVVPLYEHTVRTVRTSVLVLFASVGCVLIIACVNVANLLLTRALGRQREVAIRSAIGATRARLMRQLLTEGVVISLLGAVAGLFLASFTTGLLAAYAPNADYLPQVRHIRLDRWVFFFTLGVALLTGLGAGLFPAFHSSRSDLVNSLKDSGRSATPGRSHGYFRDVLVAAEVALSLILLVSAGLLLRSFSQLQNVHTGVRSKNTLSMTLALPPASYKQRSQVALFYQRLTDQLAAIPGVESAGLVSCVPVGGYCGDAAFRIEGQTLPPGEVMDALNRAADPGYFAAAGVPIIKGRTFTRQDGIGFDGNNPKLGVIVISESMAKTYFPDVDPIGKRISFDFSHDSHKAEPRYQVIGIVGDVLTRLDAKVQPTMYLPLLDGEWPNAAVLLHTSADPYSIAPAARQEIQKLDRDLPVYGVQTLDEIIGQSARDREFNVLLLGLFAALALLLAAIGLYGVLSYGVTQRTGEMGIRLALGAPVSSVRRLVLMQGMLPAGIGILVGLVGAAFATRLLRSLLFGVSPNDPVTFVAIPVILFAVAGLACAIPAVRATRIDPAMALRSE